MLLLFVLAFALYNASIGFGYVLDDEIVLSENQFVKKGCAGIKDIFTTDSFTGYLGEQQDLLQGARYRPLSIITFAIEYQLFKLNPKISHFINVLLYALTAVILFHLLTLLFPAHGKKWFPAIPFIAAALFTAHPLHTEAVANIKSRDEILSFLFSILALFFSIRFIRAGRAYYLLLSALAFFTALLAKENALTFLAVIPLAIYFFECPGSKKILSAFLPLLFATGAYLLLRYAVIGYLVDSGKAATGLMNNPFLHATATEKNATIFYTLLLYLKLLLFPHPLTHDYYPYQIPILDWSDFRAMAGLLVYAALGAFALFNFKKRSIPAFSVLYFLFTVSIVSNLFVPVGTFMNERFLYMPSLGFCILIAYWLVEKIPALVRKSALSAAAVPVIFGIFIVSYSFKTLQRVPEWKDILTLSRSAATVSTNSARANSFYAYELYRTSLGIAGTKEKLKMMDEAMPYVERALKIYPTYPDALTTKAGLLAAYYQHQHHDLNKLLDGFYAIQTASPIPFVDEYLNYLDRAADASQLKIFYTRLGNTLEKSGNKARAKYYFDKAAH